MTKEPRPVDPAPPEAVPEGIDPIERLRGIHRENERLFERLVEGEQRFRSLARSVWEVQEEERRRVAHELHDGLGQTLTALKIRLERLGARAEIAPALAGELTTSVDLAARALDEARRLAHLLRPQVLDDLGLYPALRWLSRTLGEWTGFEVGLDLAGAGEAGDGGDRLDPELETLAFRVVQEGLTNAMKHSGVGGAEVRVARAPGVLRLEVSDRGAGFEVDESLAGDQSSAGFGLRGMRERVELAGGRFELSSRRAEGTCLGVTLPVADPGEER